MIRLQKLLGCGVAALALSALWLAGCSSDKKAEPPKSDHSEHTSGMDHHDADQAHDDHDHDAKALTEKDVALPASFQAGIDRLQELHGKIDHLIEHNELSDVHHVAEEMGIVAKHMKELARQNLPQDKQTEAGRLCNQIAGYFHPIDEAADAGNKAETQAIHNKMKADIESMKSLTK